MYLTKFGPKYLGPNNTLDEQVLLGHLHCSKMDLIQILVIFSHMKLDPIIRFICLFQKIENPNKTDYMIFTWFLNISLNLEDDKMKCSLFFKSGGWSLKIFKDRIT
jgi:hypothetical protein